MKKLALTTFALLCGVGIASADPIVLPGNTPLVLDFENIEQLNVNPDPASCIEVPGATAGCADNWGFLRFLTIRTSTVLNPNTDIADGGTTTLYDTGANGTTEIFGFFYGLDITGCSAVGCTATGGVIDLYWHDTGIAGITNVAELDPTLGAVNAVTGGTFLARLRFDNGIISNDDTTTVTSNVDLTTTFDQGIANGFISVDTSLVGPWTNVLNGNWFFIDGAGDADAIRGNGVDEQRDIKFRNGFSGVLPGSVAVDWNTCAPSTANPVCVGLDSSDPAEVFTLAEVPEPASLVLFGTGLGLAGLVARRRKKQ